MIEKEFDAITKEDIEALVTTPVSEDRTIEYKQQLPVSGYPETKEFLADVSSFANAGGGDLIYGIREQRDANGQPTGIPEAVEGLSGVNTDQEKARLESKILAGIEPRIPEIRIRHVDGFTSGPVIIIRVHKSWASPHMVKFKNTSRFYSRTSGGKYQLDVHELRAAFLASETLTEKISSFRDERVRKILARTTPQRLDGSPQIALHLLPVRGFAESHAVDLKAAFDLWGHKEMRQMGWPRRTSQAKYNLWGLWSSGHMDAPETPVSYIQLFRNGAIEAVCSGFGHRGILPGNSFEPELIDAVSRFLTFQRKLDVGPPVFIAVTIVNASGFRVVYFDKKSVLASGQLLPEEVLSLPEVLLDVVHKEPTALLHSTFDTIAQASQLPQSYNYDAQGRWDMRSLELPVHVAVEWLFSPKRD